MEQTTEELCAHDGDWGVDRHSADGRDRAGERRPRFAFSLFNKYTGFGDITIRQFWMKHNGLYGSRKIQATHGNAIPDFFWTGCQIAKSCQDPGPRQSYILAKLLPLTRRYGARRVFDDAVLRSPRCPQEEKRSQIERLNEQLTWGRSHAIHPLVFHDRTARLLGPPDFSEDVVEEYERLTSELLGNCASCNSPFDYPDTSRHAEILQDWMHTVARRSGRENTKLALDMLSYESRAAFHRCYSVVWRQLLPHLRIKYGLDEVSVLYHQLMHIEVVTPRHAENSYFHLFHGHIFALHPGTSLFLQTQVGGELIADVLRVRDDLSFHRLLNGFWIALLDYAERSERLAQERAGGDAIAYVDDPDDIKAQQTGGQHRRGRAPGASDCDHPIGLGDAGEFRRV